MARDGLPITTFQRVLPRAVGAFTLKIADIRENNLKVHHLPVNSNWYHGGIIGIKGSDKKKLHKAAIEITPIDQNSASYFDLGGREII